MRDALGRPFLVLQFDGHSNDAGMMTRCEAYLDSKGFLSAWEVGSEKRSGSEQPVGTLIATQTMPRPNSVFDFHVFGVPQSGMSYFPENDAWRLASDTRQCRRVEACADQS